MARVLIIDDNRITCERILEIIHRIGHQAEFALTLNKGLERVSLDSFDLVFLDVFLPDGNGLRVISDIKQAQSSPEVVIITGKGSRDGAETAIKSGSWDYIQKPFTMAKIQLILSRVLQYREEKATQKTSNILKRENIVGSSPEINRCLANVSKATDNDTNILITGETGTGKELFAKAIHENSKRAGNAFVVVDCAALPENLIESTLFGNEKGAFTGANLAREGLIKEADGGTLFLDEVGELPLPQQRIFLRVLQERRFRSIGGKRDMISNFRLIAATNRNINEMVKAGTFREDLLFRIQALLIQIPPLRNRIGDIKEIVNYYIMKLSDKYSWEQKEYSPEFLEAIMSYHWPGNVRELIHTIEYALSESSNEPTLFPVHLPIHIRSRLVKNSIVESRAPHTNYEKDCDISGSFPELREWLDTSEKEYFQRLINFTGGEIKEICRISGISRSKLYIRLKKYNLSRSDS